MTPVSHCLVLLTGKPATCPWNQGPRLSCSGCTGFQAQLEYISRNHFLRFRKVIFVAKKVCRIMEKLYENKDEYLPSPTHPTRRIVLCCLALYCIALHYVLLHCITLVVLFCLIHCTTYCITCIWYTVLPAACQSLTKWFMRIWKHNTIISHCHYW